MVKRTLFLRLLGSLTVALSLTLGSRLAAQETPKPQDASKAPLAGMGTTKGPFAPGVQPEMLWDGRKLAPFHALDLPKMVKASEAVDFIEPSEYVLGVTVQGQSRAYPSRFIGWHHIINDKVTTPDKGEVWYAVTYCSVCNTGIRYNLTLNGKPIKLDFYGLYNGVVTLCDRESESVFLHVSGKFINGPLLGKELTPEPLLDTTWGEWKRLHPDTLIMSPDNEYSARYRPKGQIVQRGNTRFGMPYFQASVTRGDKRLPPFDKVLGVTLAKGGAEGSEAGTALLRRAYPIKALQEAGGVVNDSLGEMPAAVFFDPKTISACAVSRRLDGKTLTFEARKAQDDTVAYYDKETGTRWSIEGKAEEGMLAGKSLDRLDAHLSQWYGWFAYFPDTTIYGHTEPPQPGNPFEVPAEKGAPADTSKKP